MTKRSVILVGVLIVMVALGSAAIGVVSSKAATEAANGTYFSFLPLVMKAYLSSGDTFIGNFEYPYGLSNFAAVSPFGQSTATDEGWTAREFPFPVECVAQDLQGALTVPAGSTLESGYRFEFRMYVHSPLGNSPGLECIIHDPDLACSSTGQLTIPADSLVSIQVQYKQGLTEKLFVPFSWECN